MRPTEEAYDQIQQAFDHFNKTLFGNELPDCLITFQRSKNTMGYFSPKKFIKDDGAIIDEIAMNPQFFAVINIVEIFQTLVHEMCHLWQFHYGEKQPRGRYHDQEWGNQMQSVGLMPSATGQPGGRKTGDSMADYVIDGGAFETQAKNLLSHEFVLSWADRVPTKPALLSAVRTGNEELVKEVLHHLSNEFSDEYEEDESFDELNASEMISQFAPETPQTRAKFSCPGCGSACWGKQTVTDSHH